MNVRQFPLSELYTCVAPFKAGFGNLPVCHFAKSSDYFADRFLLVVTPNWHGLDCPPVWVRKDGAECLPIVDLFYLYLGVFFNV